MGIIRTQGLKVCGPSCLIQKKCGNPRPFEWPMYQQLGKRLFLWVPTSHEMTGWHPQHECQPRPPFPRSCGEQQGGFRDLDSDFVDFLVVSELHILLMWKDGWFLMKICQIVVSCFTTYWITMDYRDELAQTRRWHGQTTFLIISCIWVGSIVLLTCIGSNWCLALHRQWWIEGQKLEDSHMYCSLGWDHIDQLYIYIHIVVTKGSGVRTIVVLGMYHVLINSC